MSEAFALTLIGVSLSMNAVFLSRLLKKVDSVYDCLAGTTERPGLLDRMARVESFLSDHFNFTTIERRGHQ